MPKKKNAAAADLARKRWSKIDKKTRSAIMTKVIRARYAKKGAK